MTKLIVISAPSGAGKTTLCRRLLQDFPQLELSISWTTRSPRSGERRDMDYFFISEGEFKERIRNGQFAEWAQVHGNYYGTSKEVIDRALESGKPVLFDIDVQGAESLRRAYPAQCVAIFIQPPGLGELEKRLRTRGTDSEETIQRRMNNARSEMAAVKDFHHVIINDSLDRAYAELEEIVGKYLHGKP